MAMKPCPGCGMPRAEDQLGTVPCPICSLSPPAAEAPEEPAARTGPPAPAAAPGGRGWSAWGAAAAVLAVAAGSAVATGYLLRPRTGQLLVVGGDGAEVVVRQGGREVAVVPGAGDPAELRPGAYDLEVRGAAGQPGGWRLAADRVTVGRGAVAVARVERLRPDAPGRGGGAEAVPPPDTPEVTLSGTTLLTPSAFGRSHVCAGAAADFTVTLPSPAGNAGRSLWVRMSPDLTRLVTLAAGGGVTIDKEPARVMWAGEAALLRTDGAHWFKVAGVARPMACVMRRSTGQSIPGETLTPVGLNATDADNTGRMADPARHRAVVRRAGNYLVTGVVPWATWEESAAARVVADCERNGDGVVLRQGETSTVVGAVPHPDFTAVVPLAAGDTVRLRCYHDGRGPQGLYAGPTGSAPLLTLLEQPSW